MTSRLQGRDAVVVRAPVARLWPIIADSRELPRWGPPVRSVELLGPASVPEGIGARRRVHAEFDGRLGQFVEHRTEHVEGVKVAYVIDEDSFGVLRLLSEPGFSLELEAIDDVTTRVVFSFFHDTRGLLGAVLNPLVILRKQRANRLAALESLRRYAETGTPRG